MGAWGEDDTAISRPETEPVEGRGEPAEAATVSEHDQNQPDQPDQPDQPEPPDLLRDISERLTVLDEMTRAVKDLAQAASLREAHFERLHREQQQMRSEEAGRAFLPLFRDLITLSDQLTTAGIDDFADSVVAILERYGVTIYRPAPGEPFAPRLHRGVATVPTHDAEADKTIARLIRPGFLFQERPLRTAEVEVYRVVAPESETTETTETTETGEGKA